MNWKRWIGIVSLMLAPITGNAVTPMIASDPISSLLLNSDGSVWVTGYSGATSPARLFELFNVTAVATSNNSYFQVSVANSTYYALLADGTLWAMGNNNFGQLGDGTTQIRSQTQIVPGLSAIKAVAVSDHHVLALKEDGTVWAWGNNWSGQLGDGTTTDRHEPTQVIGLTNVTKLAANAGHSLALRSDGTVWMWGDARFGAAGDGTFPGDYDLDRNHLVPTQVQIDGVIAISGGWYPSVALRADGTVWVWGQDGSRGYSVPTQVPGLDHIIAIESKGERYTLALKGDGTVWGWGYNNRGQLGVSGVLNVSTPIQIPGLSDIVAISIAREYAMAMRSDGTVLAWGVNSDGQLGDGTLQDRVEPRPVLGPGGTGQLNLIQTAPAQYNRLPSAQINLGVSSGKAPLAVEASASNASDTDGSIAGYSWISSDGQQAIGSSAAFVFAQPGTYQINLLVEDNNGGRSFFRQQVIVTPVAATAIATPKVGIGGGSGIALASDGIVLTWGEYGRLGIYDPQVHPKSLAVPIANGITGAIDIAIEGSGGHALLADGTVLGWGGNSSGTPGVGNSSASQIMQPQPLPNLPPVKKLAAGNAHVLALTQDGRVFGWGSNYQGELGLGDNSERFAPVEITALGSSVAAIAAGASHAVALKSDGTVWAWGDNTGYQLGNGTRNAANVPIQIPGLGAVTDIFSSSGNIFAQAADGTVWVTGSLPMAIAGDPGASAGPRRLSVFDGAMQIAGGGRHVIVLKSEGTVWIGGQQSSFALGFADSGNIDGLKQIPGITGATGVAAADNNSAVVLGDGTVLTWGRNGIGQLGDGTFANRLTPVAALNETTDGFLDLIPGTDFELPPSVGVPFFVVASGSVSDAAASVSTRTKFNAGDVGKNGEVYVTATVPSGSLVPVTSPMSAAGSTGASATTAGGSFVLVNLTASGQWQPVTNGQVLPYASGVFGDQLSAQTILDNTDTTNLKGAQFCLGYGASAAQMIASGTMRVVASIPDPNATGVTTTTCLLAGPPVSYSLNLPSGWNLLGNSLNQALTVSTLFDDTNAITSVWKWDPYGLGWQFYTPSMTATELQTYAASKGYAVLTAINPGEGYWVNAKSQPTLSAQAGDSFILTGMNLAKGWNLVATGNDIAPAEFNAGLKASAVPASLKTLWAWDNPSAKWFFYAPSLEAQGATALSDYIANKGYLDFTTTNKKLGNGTGFWVNR